MNKCSVMISCNCYLWITCLRLQMLVDWQAQRIGVQSKNHPDVASLEQGGSKS